MREEELKPQFRDDQLLAYLEGDLDPEISAQIEKSPADCKRAQELAGLERRLAARLYRIECPESQVLGEYSLGLLSRAEAQAIAAHLQDCPHCSAELAGIREFMREAGPQVSPGKGIRMLLARLISGPGSAPSGGMAPAFATRGQNEEAAVYAAEGFRITLMQREDRTQAGKKSITGLLVGEGPARFTLQLRSSQGETFVGEVDALGNFVVAGLSPGMYALDLIGPDQVIHIPELEVK